MKVVTVFYAGLLYGEYDDLADRLDWPDDVVIYKTAERYITFHPPGWYRKDFTPILEEEVPAKLKVLLMLLQ